MGASKMGPVRNATTFAELLADFAVRFGPDGPLEGHYMWYMKNAPDLRTAVDRAVRSRMPNGKMHNHQSKVPLYTLLEYGKVLYRHLSKYDTPSWKSLMDTCWNIRPWGIGPVTSYDVGMRLGWWYKLEPDRLYLHAGVTEGVKALGLRYKGKSWLFKEDLPYELQHLSYNEIEDFMCTYRTVFPQIKYEMEEPE